jgi:hypothetical protein
MESLSALDEDSAHESEKAAAIKKRREADTASLHAATAKSVALESVMSVTTRLEGKIEKEKSKGTWSEDHVSIYKTLLGQQYENLKSHMQNVLSSCDLLGYKGTWCNWIICSR